MTTAAGPSHVYVGAAKWTGGSKSGVFRRGEGASRWELCNKGLPDDVHVQAITVHPTNPDVVYVGTQNGPYRSVDRGERWERLPFPEDGGQVWSISVHPKNPRTLFVGTSPVAIYRSDDEGASWRKLPNAVQAERVKMPFACRVMRIEIDPAQPDHIYAALEVGGAMRSLDGGVTWDDCSGDLVKLSELPHLKSRIVSDSEMEGMLDGHALCVSPAASGTVILALRMGLFRSTDNAAHWKDMEVGRLLTADLQPRHPRLAAGPARALRLPEPGRAERGRLGLPERRPGRDVDALRPRDQGGEHDDGGGAPSARRRPRVLREPHRPGLRHRGRRAHLARERLPDGVQRRLRDRLRVKLAPLITGPLITGPLITGPLITGPLITGPLITGPLITGPLTLPSPHRGEGGSEVADEAAHVAQVLVVLGVGRQAGLRRVEPE